MGWVINLGSPLQSHLIDAIFGRMDKLIIGDLLNV